MFVRPTVKKSRSRWRASPALFGMFAVLAVGVTALAQLRVTGDPFPTTNPATAPTGTSPTGGLAATRSATTSPVPAVTEPAEDPVGVMLLWDLFLKGGYVMWVLAACSVLAVAIIFERLYALRKSRVVPSRFLPGLRTVYKDPVADRGRAIAYCEQEDSPMARMVSAFIKRLPRGFTAAEKALEDAGGNEVLRLRANLRIFYAIGSVATLLGLIGTIAGMIKAFMVTAKAGNADNKVELLSTGIYEAMVCTFGGLAVAIIVTMFYYYFVNKVEKLITEINDELSSFTDEFAGPLSPVTRGEG